VSSSSTDSIEAFLSRWENSGASERANYQMFLSELCDILAVPRPDPTSPDPEKNLYVLDRAITRVNPDGSSVTNYIDLYKARHCVWETKQGITAEENTAATKTGHGRRGTTAFDRALERAYHQGRDYITYLPASHGRPPFLVVCDVGHSIELLGICFLREAPERAIGTDRRARKWEGKSEAYTICCECSNPSRPAKNSFVTAFRQMKGLHPQPRI
jgi:hypothetical protein